MRIALVHDDLNQLGGAEIVLKAFHDMFPHAPIYTLVDNGRISRQYFKKARINTSFLQRLPGGVKGFKWLLPLHPTAFEHFNLTEYDVVLSDSSAFSKGVITKPNTLHVCYCHTPTRYLWHDTHNYTEDLHQGRIVKKILPLLLTRLRLWDYLAARRVDKYIANSGSTAKRIKKYYQRESTIIYPPIDWNKFYVADEPHDYYLMLGRLRPYKRFDLAIKAFNELGLPLVIVGQGEEYKNLKKIAGPNITLLRNVTDAQKVHLFAHAQAFIHPQLEDCGITALESMAAGRPVLAYNEGGALETVLPGITGEFFDEQTPEALIRAIRTFEPAEYDPEKIRAHAKSFDVQRFQQQILQFILQARRERAQAPLPMPMQKEFASNLKINLS